MIECCKTCVNCKYINTPSITGHPVDYVCELKGSVVDDIEIKNCDEMYKAKNIFFVKSPESYGTDMTYVEDLTEEELKEVARHIAEIKQRKR